MAGQNVEIKLGRNAELAAVGENRFDQAWMIEDGIARFRIAQKIDQRNVIALRAGKGADDKIEIGRGKSRPTIRPDHRELIMSNADAKSKPVCVMSAGVSENACASGARDAAMD